MSEYALRYNYTVSNESFSDESFSNMFRYDLELNPPINTHYILG